jgi:hypothetical protein
MIKILLFEDKLGVTQAYQSIWQLLLLRAGMGGASVAHRKTFTAFGNRIQLLFRNGNRVAPGFNPDPDAQRMLATWVESQITTIKPDIVLCCDAALTFLVNPEWNQSTLDNLRGGAYEIHGVPFLITLPITVWHQKKNEKDLARLNEGYTDKEKWEIDHGGDQTDSEELNGMWLEPMTIPYGKFVLQADLNKAHRIIQKRKLLEITANHEVVL